MRRGAVVVAALLILFGLAWAALDRLPISDEVRASFRRKLIVGFGLAVATALAVVGVAALPAGVAFAAAGGTLVLTGAYTLTADLLGLPGGTPGPDSGDSGDVLPDPCIVGPFVANGRAYICNR